MNLIAMMIRRTLFVLFALFVGLWMTTRAHAEATWLVSTTADGQAGNNVSNYPSISDDGRYIAFESAASNLVAGDTNGVTDIFVHDRQSNTITRVSLGVGGAEANAASSSAKISGDGRHVVYLSTATNLAAGITNGRQHVFVYDRVMGTTACVSVSSSGTPASDNSFSPAISSNGRYVVFESYATNLAGTDADAVADVFLRDRGADYNDTAGVTTLISANTSGTQPTGESRFPAISRNGLFVSFAATGMTLVNGGASSARDIYLWDLNRNTLERISVASSALANGDSSYSSISDDGNTVAFASLATNLVSGDTNAKQDVFVRNRQTGITTRVSLSDSEAQSGYDSSFPVISANGRYVGFVSESSALYQRASKTVSGDFDAISAATGGGGGGGGTTIPSVIYRRDTTQNVTVRVSSNNSGTASSATSNSLAMNADGTLIAFGSTGSNLACSGDGNDVSDVFLRDLNSGAAPACTTSSGSTSSGKSGGGGALRLFGLLVLALTLAGFRVLRRRSGPRWLS
jgi:Tol biopolymer transport system component